MEVPAARLDGATGGGILTAAADLLGFSSATT
jgi:hypothetical protein